MFKGFCLLLYNFRVQYINSCTVATCQMGLAMHVILHSKPKGVTI